MKLNLGKYSKFIVALVGAIVTAISLYYDTTPEWLGSFLPFLTAIGVYRIPNQQ